MSQNEMLVIRVSLKGRPLRSYTFASNEIVVGRDPDADVFLDNPGISRRHCKFERTLQGFVVEDLQSANGTILNDRSVSRELVSENDVVRIGKFALWVSMKQDRREPSDSGNRRLEPDALQGTTVLSNDQLARILDSVRESEEEAVPLGLVQSPAPEEAPEADRPWRTRSLVFWIVVAFVLGMCLSAGLIWYLLARA